MQVKILCKYMKEMKKLNVKPTIHGLYRYAELIKNNEIR